MAKFNGLSIPEGLEAEFLKATQGSGAGGIFSEFGIHHYVKRHQFKQTWTRAQKTKARSLLVILHASWLAISADAKLWWHVYWEGWPGSGYSSYIQENGKRRKNGDPLIVNPPGKMYFTLGFEIG